MTHRRGVRRVLGAPTAEGAGNARAGNAHLLLSSGSPPGAPRNGEAGLVAETSTPPGSIRRMLRSRPPPRSRPYGEKRPSSLGDAEAARAGERSDWRGVRPRREQIAGILSVPVHISPLSGPYMPIRGSRNRFNPLFIF